MENCSLGLEYSLSGCMEIYPCVLQDIGPLGPLPCSHSTSLAITPSRASGSPLKNGVAGSAATRKGMCRKVLGEEGEEEEEEKEEDKKEEEEAEEE